MPKYCELYYHVQIENVCKTFFTIAAFKIADHAIEFASMLYVKSEVPTRVKVVDYSEMNWKIIRKWGYK